MSSFDAQRAVREYIVPDSVAARLSLVIGRVNRRLAVETGGLSHGMLMALATVAKQGPIRLAELAAIEQVSPPSMTRLVAELESRELVVRRVDRDDRRAVQLKATPAGLEAILRARSARAQVIGELLGGLDPADLASIEAAIPALERTADLL